MFETPWSLLSVTLSVLSILVAIIQAVYDMKRRRNRK